MPDRLKIAFSGPALPATGALVVFAGDDLSLPGPVRDLIGPAAGEALARAFAAENFRGKAGSAVPLGLALPLIAWFGFDPQAASQPASGVLALSLVFSLVPAVAHLLATLLMRGFSIDEERQIAIRQALEARENPA